jgi:hypothetical protein
MLVPENAAASQNRIAGRAGLRVALTGLPRPSLPRGVWLPVLVAAAVLAGAAAWVLLTDMRPSYDAFGWLDWGRQVLHWDLDTNGAPSWKPLPFLFTLPYALVGANPQVWLWMVTATAGALAGAVFAARIAHRLSGPCPERRWAPLAAGAFAGLAVLGLRGYSGLVLISNSDPMVVALCLAAVDSHLSGRRRLAFVLIVLVSFGRPEGWAFAGLYAIWSFRVDRSMRPLAVAGLVLIPLAWFVVPALTSHSWLTAGDLALNSPNVLHGNKIVGVLQRVRGLYESPMQLAFLAALVTAVLTRDRRWLGLLGAAALWVLVEIAFALHGWSAVPRYLLEPGALLVVLTAAGLGRLLARVPAGGGLGRRAAQATTAALALALVGSLVPAARSRARIAHGQIDDAHRAAVVLKRLEAVIRKDGGAARIKACGQPVTLLGYQSEVAWAIGLSVGEVGFRPGKEIREGVPMVVLKPHDGGWQVRPFHLLAADASRCQGLRTDSALDATS